MRASVVECRRQLIEQVPVVAQSREHSDLFEQSGLTVPDAFDEHRDPAAFER